MSPLENKIARVLAMHTTTEPKPYKDDVVIYDNKLVDYQRRRFVVRLVFHNGKCVIIMREDGFELRLSAQRLIRRGKAWYFQQDNVPVGL
jgi:hypothetical protein